MSTFQSYQETVIEDNEPQGRTERFLKAAKWAAKMVAKKTSQHAKAIYLRIKNMNKSQHGVEGFSLPSMDGHEETGRAGQETGLPSQRESSDGPAVPGI